MTTTTRPRRPSALDVRLVEAVERFRLAHARVVALADERTHAADYGRPARPGFYSEAAEADRTLAAAERDLAGLLADCGGAVLGGVAYMMGPAGRVIPTRVRCLDGRCSGRLPGLEVG